MKKLNILRQFALSRFLAKVVKLNKIDMKSFSFEVDFKLYIPPLRDEIFNTHNKSGMRIYVVILTKGLQ